MVFLFRAAGETGNRAFIRVRMPSAKLCLASHVEVVGLIKDLIDFLLLCTLVLVVLLPGSMKSILEGKALYSIHLKSDVIFFFSV